MRIFGGPQIVGGPEYGGRSRAFYEAGWRPALGWLCILAILLHFVAVPCLNIWCSLKGQALALSPFDLPAINALLNTTLTMGGLRTLEKFWGIATPTGQQAGTVINVVNPQTAPA